MKKSAEIKKIAATARRNFFAYCKSINSFGGDLVCPEFTALRNTPCGILGLLKYITKNPASTPAQITAAAPKSISSNTFQNLRWAELVTSDLRGRYTITDLGRRFLAAYNA